MSDSQVVGEGQLEQVIPASYIVSPMMFPLKNVHLVELKYL